MAPSDVTLGITTPRNACRWPRCCGRGLPGLDQWASQPARWRRLTTTPPPRRQRICSSVGSNGLRAPAQNQAPYPSSLFLGPSSSARCDLRSVVQTHGHGDAADAVTDHRSPGRAESHAPTQQGAVLEQSRHETSIREASGNLLTQDDAPADRVHASGNWVDLGSGVSLSSRPWRITAQSTTLSRTRLRPVLSERAAPLGSACAT